MQIFLCVDDTMVSKFGTKFENVSKLFDHASHNGSNYLNGHCFVSILLCVPVWNQDKVSYLSVSLGYRMWQKKESKLEMAASMIRQIMPEFQNKEHIIILCDSWYTKQNLVSIVDEYPNLDLIHLQHNVYVLHQVCDVASSAYLPHSGKSRLGCEAGAVMKFVFIPFVYCWRAGTC